VSFVEVGVEQPYPQLAVGQSSLATPQGPLPVPFVPKSQLATLMPPTYTYFFHRLTALP
jgi:hypothetical protein